MAADRRSPIAAIRPHGRTSIVAISELHNMHLQYVLITPARNEAAFIEKTIQAMIQQTALPVKWVIVNDGSADETAGIVNRYLSHYSWMEMVEMPTRQDRSFAAKVHSFNAGFDRVRGLAYEIIGNLDADISFDKDYFEFLLEKFSQDTRIGVAGTGYTEGGIIAKYSYKDVAGQCQIFRRECFEDIGGYFPSKYGGVDWIAVRTARMKGWKTITFREKRFSHHRLMGTAESDPWRSKIHYGKKDYFLGNHPLWQCFRVLYQMTRKPYVLGGLLLLYGYTWAFVSRMKRPISQELIEFNRKEQLERIKLTLGGLLKFKMKVFET